MELSFKCQQTQFVSSLKKYKKFSTLTIKKLSTSNIHNWNTDIATEETPSNEKNIEFINITLDDSSLSESLHKQIGYNSKDFGLYVSVGNGIDNETLDFGLLTPTSDPKIWSIRILPTEPRGISTITNYASSQLDPKYIPLFELEEILQHPQSSSSSVIIKDTYDDLKRIANEYEDSSFSISQLDIGYKPTNNANTSFKASPEKVLRSIDPIEFLCDKYFSILYNNSSILEHFVKSSIPKMHLLRRDNVKLAKDCLSKLIIESLLEFDRRHEFGITYDTLIKLDQFKSTWVSGGHLLDQTENILREEMLNTLDLPENIGDTDLAKLNEFLDKFKIKDLKLQLILDFELLKLLKTEEKITESGKLKSVPKPAEKKEPLKEKRPSLVSKRYSKSALGKKKRLIPTLLGTVIPTTVEFDADLRLDEREPKDKQLTIGVIERLINTLFDKLCMHDAITGLDYKDINSAWGFLSNCVIPFYEKDHRRLLSSLAIKARGPAYAARLKLHTEKKQRQEKRREKKLEKMKEPQSAKAERKTSTIDLSQIKLKRAHSSFSASTKADLSRKTFDMSQSVTSFTNSVHENNKSDNLPLSIASMNENEPTQPSLDIGGAFMTSKKRKLLAPKRYNVALKVQKTISKESEREKRLKELIKESNNNDPKHLFRSNQTIEATPRKKTLSTRSMPINGSPLIVESSPVSRSKISLFEQFSSPEISKTNTETAIVESPAIERVQVKPGVFEIGSSPMKLDGSPGTRRLREELQLIVDTPQRKQIIQSSSQLKNPVPVTKTSSGRSTKRKLHFN